MAKFLLQQAMKFPFHDEIAMHSSELGSSRQVEVRFRPEMEEKQEER